MSATRKFYKSVTGQTSKGPRLKRKIIAIDGVEILLECQHRRPYTGKERVGGFRRCELCVERKAYYHKYGQGKGWVTDKSY